MRSSSSSSCSFLSPLRPPLVVSLLLCTAVGGGAALSNDFSSYPAGSQKCLDSSAQSSGCTSAPTGSELNDCLCYNRGDFIYATARCVAAASPADLGAVYAQMRENCRGTGDTISVAEDSFMAQAEQATASATASATATATAPATATTTAAATKSSAAVTEGPTPTSEPPGDGHEHGDGDDGGPGGATDLSMGAKIGIGAGIGFGVVVAALAAWFIWVYSRRQRLKSEEEGGCGSGKDKDPNAAEMENASPPSGCAARAAAAAAAEYAQQNRQDSGAAELPSSSGSGSSAGWWNSPVTAEVDTEGYYATKYRWPHQASELESAVLAELPAGPYAGSELPATATTTGSEGPAPPLEVSPLSGFAPDQVPTAAVSSVGGQSVSGVDGPSHVDGGSHVDEASRANGAAGGNGGGDSGDYEDDGVRYGNNVIRSQAIATNSLMSSSVARGREDYSITSSSDTWSAWPSHDDTTTGNTALGPAPTGPANPANPPFGSRPGSSIHTQQAPRSRGSQLSS